MYRVCEVLTPEERLGAIRHGVVAKLASYGVGPSDFVAMVKSAQASAGATSPDSWISALFKLSLGLGVSVGTLHYALSSAIKPNRRSNRKDKAILDQYNDIVAKYKRQVEEEERKRREQEQGLQINKVASLDQWFDAHPVPTWIGSGLMVGGGLAAISGMISDRIEANRQKKRDKERWSDGPSADTVVFNIRKKAGDESCDADDDDSHGLCHVGRVEPMVEGREIRYSGNSQPREVDGRYSSFDKSAGRMLNNGVGLAAFIASIPLGYKLIDSLHTKLEEKRLKSQIAAAQQEYIDLLSGPDAEKNAEAFFGAIGLGTEELEKIAGSNSKPPSTWLGRAAGWVGSVKDDIDAGRGAAGRYWRGIEDLGSAGIAMLLLGTGTSAYITRKLLEKHFDNKAEEDEKPNKVTKILFKSGSSETEITPDQFIATIAVLRDCLVDSDPITKVASPFAENDEAWRYYTILKNKGLVDQFIDAPEEHWAGLRGVLGTLGIPSDKVTKENLIALREADANTGFTDPAKAIESMDPKAVKYLFDLYAKQNLGVKNDATDAEFVRRFPQLAGKFMGVAGSTDPAKIRATMMQYMRARPKEWMSYLGSDSAQQFRQAAIDKYMTGLKNGNGFMSALFKIPWLGDMIQGLTRNFLGTGWGQRMMLGRIATDKNSGFGMTPDEWRKAREGLSFIGGGGGWRYAGQGAGGGPSGGTAAVASTTNTAANAAQTGTAPATTAPPSTAPANTATGGTTKVVTDPTTQTKVVVGVQRQ